MVLDPVSAVSLAASIVGLIDFTGKVVSKGREIYKAADGYLPENRELELISKKLRNLSERLQHRTARTLIQGGKLSRSSNENEVREIAKGCSLLCKEVIEDLQRAQVKGTNQKWKSARQAIKSVRSKEHVEELRTRLDNYRGQIILTLLEIVNESQESLQSGLKRLEESTAQTQGHILEKQVETEKLLKVLAEEHSGRNTVSISERLSYLAEIDQAQITADVIYESLWFESIHDRRDAIKASHAKTFEWVFESATGTQGDSSSSLGEWLRHGKGIFWLSGKPGSGKSTLMKFVTKDDRTPSLLDKWAGATPLIIASFYFWNLGSPLQKSYQGLLRSLLYEILGKAKGLIEHVFPRRWKHFHLFGKDPTPWHLSELAEAIELMTKTTTYSDHSSKFCFFIDGLDEFDGDRETLTNSLKNLAANPCYKMCVSSRPWNVFIDGFKNCPSLQLENLTRTDIEIFVLDKVNLNENWLYHQSSEPDRAAKLVEEIIDKAAGVFLWVFLVMHSLLAGLSNGDRLSELEQTVHGLPSDLENFFHHILGTIDSKYKEQMARYFRYVFESEAPLPLLLFSFLDEEDPLFAIKMPVQTLTDKYATDRCNAISRRINSRCKGMLEIYWDDPTKTLNESNSEGEDLIHLPHNFNCIEDYSLAKIRFLHRSVYEFLENERSSSHILAEANVDFNPWRSLCAAWLAHFKTLAASRWPLPKEVPKSLHVEQILHHATTLESTGSWDSHATAILNELDVIAATEFLGEDGKCLGWRWPNSCTYPNLVPHWHTNFLALCVLYKLCAFVKDKLKFSSKKALNKPGRPLLAYAFTTSSNLKAPNKFFQDGRGYLPDNDLRHHLYFDEPQPKMIEIFLDHGSDIYQKCDDTTIAQQYIAVVSTYNRRVPLKHQETIAVIDRHTDGKFSVAVYGDRKKTASTPRLSPQIDKTKKNLNSEQETPDDSSTDALVDGARLGKRDRIRHFLGVGKT